jgi:MFS family permease
VRRHRILIVFGALTGIFASGYGVMFTMLDDFRDRYHISDGALGAVVAVGFFASFLAQVLVAPMADRGRARMLVLVGMVAEVLGLIGMAYGHRVEVLLVARLVMGIGAGTALPAIRRIVILADPEHLGSNIGKLLAADVGGFAIGPAISSVLSPAFGIAVPFLVIAVATAAFAPVVLRFHVDERTVVPDSESRFAFDLLRQRAYVAALCLGAAVFLMIGTFDALWVLVLDDLHTSPWIANLGITFFALPLFFLGPRGGRMSQRLGPFRVGSVGLLLGAGFLFTYGQLPSGLAMFFVSMVHAFNDALTVSSSGVAVGMVAPPERQAGAQGLLGGTQTLVGGMAALLAGSLYQHQGRAIAYGVCGVLMACLVLTARVVGGSSFLDRPRPDPELTPASAAS